MLIQVDVRSAIGRRRGKDLGELEKSDPEMYRNMKVGYEMQIPTDL